MIDAALSCGVRPTGNRWLRAAREAAAFIDTQAREDGLGWHRDAALAGPDDPDVSFYHGAGGVILFLLELAAASGDATYRCRAAAVGRRMAQALEAVAWLPCSLNGGWAGLIHVFDCLYEATGDAHFRRAARRCYDRLIAQAQPAGGGIGWLEPIPYSQITGITGTAEMVDLSIGAAGTLLALLHAHHRGIAADALDLARAVGTRLIELGEPTDKGTRWQMMAPMPFPFPAPNFSHGSAGVAFALIELARATGEARWLDEAIHGVYHVFSCATPRHGGGELVCHLEHAYPPTFYLGVCHGPAGTGRTLLQLDELTGEPRWRAALRRLINGLSLTGAPEQRPNGLWRNFGQCCGDAGIGDFALLLARRGIWDEGIDLADRCAQSILKASEVTNGARSWLQAEHRDRPDLLERQTGYMQGAAGMGSFLLHVGTFVDGREVGLWPLDWPRRSAATACHPLAA